MKYRVWCHNKKEWEKDDVFLSPNGSLYQRMGNGMLPLNSQTHTLEMGAGIQDDNGTWVFEGDILYWETYPTQYGAATEWHGEVKHNKETERLMILSDGEWHELDEFKIDIVAGNIHENDQEWR